MTLYYDILELSSTFSSKWSQWMLWLCSTPETWPQKSGLFSSGHSFFPRRGFSTVAQQGKPGVMMRLSLNLFGFISVGRLGGGLKPASLWGRYFIMPQGNSQEGSIVSSPGLGCMAQQDFRGHESLRTGMVPGFWSRGRNIRTCLYNEIFIVLSTQVLEKQLWDDVQKSPSSSVLGSSGSNPVTHSSRAQHGSEWFHNPVFICCAMSKEFSFHYYIIHDLMWRLQESHNLILHSR